MTAIPPRPGVDQALWDGTMPVATAFAAMPRPATEKPPPPGGNDPPAIKSAKDVGFFDPGYDGTDQPIFSVGRLNFYRNVYLFTDHLAWMFAARALYRRSYLTRCPQLLSMSPGT